MHRGQAFIEEDFENIYLLVWPCVKVLSISGTTNTSHYCCALLLCIAAVHCCCKMHTISSCLKFVRGCAKRQISGQWAWVGEGWKDAINFKAALKSINLFWGLSRFLSTMYGVLRIFGCVSFRMCVSRRIPSHGSWRVFECTCWVSVMRWSKVTHGNIRIHWHISRYTATSPNTRQHW